jgi:hypothetical protein
VRQLVVAIGRIVGGELHVGLARRQPHTAPTSRSWGGGIGPGDSPIGRSRSDQRAQPGRPLSVVAGFYGGSLPL